MCFLTGLLDATSKQNYEREVAKQLLKIKKKTVCLPKSNEERQKSEYAKEIKAELNERKRNKQMESTLFQNDRLLIILCFLLK